MTLDSLIADLALIMMSAATVTLIFRKIKQPVVLGYIVAGFLISPNFEYFPTVISNEDISTWADIGVIFLMFGLGLEFSFKKLATVGGSAFIIAITVMGSMVLIGTGVGYAFGWNQMDGVFLGCMLSMSSTMIILKSYEELGLKNEKFAQVVLGTLVIEDIVGIFMMIILSAFSVGNKDVSGIEMVQELGFMLILLAIWLIVGILVIPSFLNRATRIMSDEMLLIYSIGLCFCMVLIAHIIGFSEALGAFLTGSILAGTIHGERIEHIITPIKDLFGAIFFVSVGMLIIPSTLVEYIIPIIVISVVTIVGQSLFSGIGILLSGQSLKTAVRGGMSMVQIGEFSFILASLGVGLGVISSHLYPIIVCVSVITSFITPVMMKGSSKVFDIVNNKMSRKMRIFLGRMTSEKQSESDKEKDWFTYIKYALIRTVICSSTMLIIYLAGIKYLQPLLVDALNNGGKLICAMILIAMMVPLTRLMHGSSKDALFTKLWLKHMTNRLPLLTLRAIRIFIAAFFMALVVRSIFHIPFPLLVVIAIIPVISIVRSEAVRGVAINIELRFMANFSEKTLAKEKKERGARGNMRMINDSLSVAEFKIRDINIIESVQDFTDRRGFHGNIIKIIHDDGSYENLPTRYSPIRGNDTLHIMGSQEEIENIILLLEKEQTIDYTDRPDITLKDYIYSQTFRGVEVEKQIFCIPIKVDSTMDFCRKSIKNSHIKKNYNATIIGIERGLLPIIGPDIETIILEGDLMWILGTKDTADMLIKEGVLEPHKRTIKK